MRTSFAGRALALAMLISGAGCAASSTASPGEQVAPRTARYNRTFLSQEEMRAAHYASMFDAIQALRGTWLHARGPDSFVSPTTIWVYFDGSRIGGIETLKSFTIESVRSARFYNGAEATARWGLNHGNGVIYLSSLDDGS